MIQRCNYQQVKCENLKVVIQITTYIVLVLATLLLVHGMTIVM